MESSWEDTEQAIVTFYVNDLFKTDERGRPCNRGMRNV